MVVASALLVGCASKPTLVGEWTGSGGSFGNPTAQGGTATFNFTSDKNFEILDTSGNMPVKVSGTYATTEDKKVTMTITDAGLSGDLTDDQKALKPMLDTLFERMKGESFSATYEFVSVDEVTLNLEQSAALGSMPNAPKPAPITLKRK